MLTKLARSSTPLTSNAVASSITAQVMETFDITEPRTDFFPWEIAGILPASWRCGLVIGASGTGKSTLLKQLGDIEHPNWHPNRDVVSHFESAQDAASRLNAVGLNAVPTWLKPYRVLSTGEKFRADLARSLRHGALIDEYTSTVSRTVAQSASRSLQSWLERNEGVRNIILATCHHDVVEWLQPDWIIDTDAGTFNDEPHRVVETWWQKHVRTKDGALVCERN